MAEEMLHRVRALARRDNGQNQSVMEVSIVHGRMVNSEHLRFQHVLNTSVRGDLYGLSGSAAVLIRTKDGAMDTLGRP